MRGRNDGEGGGGGRTRQQLTDGEGRIGLRPTEGEDGEEAGRRRTGSARQVGTRGSRWLPKHGAPPRVGSRCSASLAALSRRFARPPTIAPRSSPPRSRLCDAAPALSMASHESVRRRHRQHRRASSPHAGYRRVAPRTSRHDARDRSHPDASTHPSDLPARPQPPPGASAPSFPPSFPPHPADPPPSRRRSGQAYTRCNNSQRSHRTQGAHLAQSTEAAIAAMRSARGRAERVGRGDQKGEARGAGRLHPSALPAIAIESHVSQRDRSRRRPHPKFSAASIAHRRRRSDRGAGNRANEGGEGQG